MKIYLLTFLLFFGIAKDGVSQKKQIPVSTIQKIAKSFGHCIDSTQTLTTFCSLGLDGFGVNFYSAFYNSTTRELHLIGRVCSSTGRDSPGVSLVELFKCKMTGQKLGNRIVVGETTSGKQNSNDGFFDVTFEVGKGESLFFYTPYNFVIEYPVHKLVYK